MVQGKKIILGVSGSIAAYKSAELVRQFVKAGADVRVVMTPASTSFVTPLTLATVSKHPVVSSLATDDQWNNHVALAHWADLFLVAPASCQTLAKMAHGLCDNLLLATYLSATCPVWVAPAMDSDMWRHPTTQANLRQLEQFGVRVLPVDMGELASGLTGPGRMLEPQEIVQAVAVFFTQDKSGRDWAGKQVLITAGPTYEPIDPVRFIGNRSSGKMGMAIAEVLIARGAEVHLVLGPSAEPIPPGLAALYRVETAQQMYEQAIAIFSAVDVAILSAAVADYTPVHVATEKIKKEHGGLPTLVLTETVDILATLGKQKQTHQCVVGFALETHNETENAKRKLERKQADFIVLNSLREAGAGFGSDTNKISIFDKTGRETNYPLASKLEVAKFIVDQIAS